MLRFAEKQLYINNSLLRNINQVQTSNSHCTKSISSQTIIVETTKMLMSPGLSCLTASPNRTRTIKAQFLQSHSVPSTSSSDLRGSHMEPGWYTITSMVEEQYEDRSLHDKPIFLLPNIKEQIPIASVWNIEKTGEDRYRLSTRGNFTAIQDDRVLTAQPQHGENVYMIQTNDEEKGWTADGGEHSQIATRPLASTDSIPPPYTSTQLLIIISAAHNSDSV
ncbi:hypothetical protein ABKN59_001748 [Abortiporus biennis]